MLYVQVLFHQANRNASLGLYINNSSVPYAGTVEVTGPNKYSQRYFKCIYTYIVYILYDLDVL